jgi:hypothetical protein
MPASVLRLLVEIRKHLFSPVAQLKSLISRGKHWRISLIWSFMPGWTQQGLGSAFRSRFAHYSRVTRENHAPLCPAKKYRRKGNAAWGCRRGLPSSQRGLRCLQHVFISVD